MLIVVKPHFAQITNNIRNYCLSNILFIDDTFFDKNNISSYEFVGSTDGLITDYSSIYYDYTLCDKPICLIWDDIENYRKNPGLIDRYEYLMSGGEKAYSVDDLISFVDRVYKGIDILKEERNNKQNG